MCHLRHLFSSVIICPRPRANCRVSIVSIVCPSLCPSCVRRVSTKCPPRAHNLGLLIQVARSRVGHLCCALCRKPNKAHAQGGPHPSVLHFALCAARCAFCALCCAHRALLSCYMETDPHKAVTWRRSRQLPPLPDTTVVYYQTSHAIKRTKTLCSHRRCTLYASTRAET